MRGQIYWITRNLAVGPYPVDNGVELAEHGITHVLNVAAPVPGHFRRELFQEVVAVPFPDHVVMSPSLVKEVTATLYRLVTLPESRVYVHCSAGQNRSPTVIWLTLVALGFESDKVKRLIESASIDAVPGHPALVPPNSGLVQVAIDQAKKENWRAPMSIRTAFYSESVSR